MGTQDQMAIHITQY